MMANMKAARLHDFGGPEVLKLDDVPVPTLKDDEVLVKIHAASINPVDYKIRSGKFPMYKREQLPVTLGRDLSGVVERYGKSAPYFKPGDAVYALLDHEHGSYAEYVAIKGELCSPKPPNISHEEAAAIPLAALTAFQGLFEHGQLKAKQRVLIHGGAGGVGHFAIQLAVAKGARVCTTVGADDMEFVSELGADEALDHKADRFEDTIQEVDLVLDLIGGETQERSWKVLKRGGTMVSTLAQPSEERAREHDARVAVFMTQPNPAQLVEITRLVQTGELIPHIAAKFSLAQAAAAQQRVEREHTRGKVVLTVASA
jgi:NADPH:quinone reductase-like Zn-dependent oxidoreductase